MDYSILLDVIGFLILGVGVGLGCGSYATMPYYRLPTGESCAGKWIGKKSHCVHCDAILKTRHLLPVFNWFVTKGKCYNCGYKVNKVYFFIESGVTLFSILSYLKFGPENLNLHLMVLGLGTCLVILAAIDYTYRKLPDAIFIVMVMFSFLYHSPEQFYDMINVFVITVLISIAYARSKEEKSKEKYERYDLLKFLCVAGIWFTFAELVIFFVLFLVLSAIVKAANKSDKGPAYGLAMSLSFMVTILTGADWLIDSIKGIAA